MYRMNANRPSSYYSYFLLLVEVQFENPRLDRWLLPLILFESSFYSRARIYRVCKAIQKILGIHEIFLRRFFKIAVMNVFSSGLMTDF